MLLKDEDGAESDTLDRCQYCGQLYRPVDGHQCPNQGEGQ